MKFEGFIQENNLVIKVMGRMDASNSNLLEEEAENLGKKENTTNLILDLEGLEYISSAGLRSILVIGKKLKAENGVLKLCNLSGMVMEVFEISGFNSIFQIFDSVEGAIEEE